MTSIIQNYICKNTKHNNDLSEYLAIIVSISGKRQAATEGARCTKVPNNTIQSPISSSLYSSLRVPQSLHLQI